MGRYFSYEPVQPWAGGIGKVFEGVSRGLDARRKQEEMDAEIEQKKASTKAYVAQTDATTANIKRQQSKDDITFQQGQEDRRGKVGKDIAELLGQGRPGAAETAAGASQFWNQNYTDPKTGAKGRMEGITLTPDQLGPEPVAPVAPEAPALPQDRPDALPNVQVLTPDQARAQAMAKGLRNPTQPPLPGSAEELMAKTAGEEAFGKAQRVQRERGLGADDQLQYDINKSTYETQQKPAYDAKNTEYQASRAKWNEEKAHPKYTIGMPGGQSIHFDPQEYKNAKSEEARQKADLLETQAAKVATTDPAMSKRYWDEAVSIRAELSAASAGRLGNASSQTQAEGVKQDMQGKQITSNETIGASHDRAKVTAAGLSGGGGANSARARGMAELIEMKESALGPNGEVLDPHINSKIAARAAELGIPSGGKAGWSGPVGEVIRGPAVAARHERAEAANEATDAEGNFTGKYKPGQALVGNKSEISYSLVRKRLQEIQADYKANGPRVADPQKMQNRLSMITALQAALRPYNELGGTDASQRLEREIQGASGTPESLKDYVLGLNPDIYERILGEVEFRHTGAQKVRLRAGSGPGAGRNPQGIAAGARGQKAPGAAPEGKRIRNKKTGETGVLAPDGTFHPDGG